MNNENCDCDHLTKDLEDIYCDEIIALRNQLAATTAWLRAADKAIDDATSLLIDGLTRTPLGVLRDYQAQRQACVEAAVGGNSK